MLDRIFLSMVLAAAPASGGKADKSEKPAKPADPATQPAADAAAYETLDNGRVQFIPPTGWTKSDASSTPMRSVYMSDTREGAISIEVPPDMTISPGTAAAIVKDLKAKRKKAGSSLADATIEKDPRFDIRIHEQYKQGSRTSDQLHLYKQVGSRVVMATINSLSDDEETTKAIQSLGEATLVSAKLAKPQKATPSRSGAAKRRS